MSFSDALPSGSAGLKSPTRFLALPVNTHRPLESCFHHCPGVGVVSVHYKQQKKQLEVRYTLSRHIQWFVYV